MAPKRAVKPLSPGKSVETLIHLVRGQKVMLDGDLATLYGVSTSALNQAVKRNVARFPKDFMFALATAETQNLKSQSVTSSWGGRRRSAPHAFTEHGVAMLSAVLRSPRAVQTSIFVVRAFVRMRELIASNKDIATRVEKLESGQDRTASVIEILVEDIDRVASELKSMKAIPAARKSKIGFRLNDENQGSIATVQLASLKKGR